MWKRILSVLLSVLIVCSFVPFSTVAGAASPTPTLTFTDSGITEKVSGSGYAVSGTTLTITSGGAYIIEGSCQEGNIEVDKSLSGVTLILRGLDLTSSTTAPIAIKKSSEVTIYTEGESTIRDAEDPANEASSDADVADAFEGAVIKVKSGSSVVFCGDGTMNVDGSSCKNGIKGAATSSFIFNSGTYNVRAANNGIAADGTVTFNAGTYVIDTDGDGIKSVPDATDTESSGSVYINGGSFEIETDGDGIQAETKLEVNNGYFNIKTLDGYDSSSFDGDTMSCKGLKASGDREDIENDIEIKGGTFVLNTADDAVHSDTNCEISGGTFTIDAGDDGIHADAVLTLGTEDGAYDRDPDIEIAHSYEGLEGGNVYIYQGRYKVYATDDGINAAGGSSNGSDNHGWGGGDGFKPGGGGWGGPGQQGGTSSSDYNLYIYGGNVYVDCLGDGLDSNGGLYLYGGITTVFSQASGGDNSPLDSDGSCIIEGATLFAAGSNPMNERATIQSQQSLTQTTRRNADAVVSISDAGSTVYSTKLPRNINYLLYTDASSSSLAASDGGSVDACHSDDWAHSWDEGETTEAATAGANGVITYTCSACGATEEKSALYYDASGYACGGHAGGETDAGGKTDAGYTVVFHVGEGASIQVYHTQDYTSPSETGVSSTVSRNGDTGAADSSGDGQVNFEIVVADGYELDGDPVIEGTYKNLKNVSTDDHPNTYRITKIESGLTVSVSVKKKTAGGTPEGSKDSKDTEKNTVPSGGANEGSGSKETDGGKNGQTVGSAVEKGADASDAVNAITSTKTDKDLSGTQYGGLSLRSTKQTKKSITINYNKVNGAATYIILANKCGGKNAYKKVATTAKRKLTVKKIAGKKVKAGTYYKFVVIAVDKDGKVVMTSKSIHVATKGGKVGNAKGITVKNLKALKKEMKINATKKIQARITKLSGAAVKKHRALSYESTDAGVAVVDGNGKITAKGKGACYIYIYTQNGLMKKIQIKVK